jgi:AcrR family transcriptional regulator
MNTAKPSDAVRTDAARRRHARGQGDQLRVEILAAATEILERLQDDEALSLRAVARDIGVAAPSVYLHFADRDELVLAVMEACHAELAAAVENGAAQAADPVDKLRRRAATHVEWALRHPGLYKVLHESGLNQRADTPLKRWLTMGTVQLVQACIDSGLAVPSSAELVALDLQTAIHGMMCLRINNPDYPWPPYQAQVERFLVGLVGLAQDRDVETRDAEGL